MTSSELSDVSSLSSAESIETDEEILNPKPRTSNLEQWLKLAKAPSPSPPPKKRAPSPPHEYVLADNPDIAFLVMFRARFAEAFPRSCPHFGPQDIERGVEETVPDEGVEKFLCCLLGLVLNRKKDVEKGHYMRALEEAVQTNSYQWPVQWENKNPLHGGGSFNNMTPTQRLALLRALTLWALNSSDAVQTILKEMYKQQRHEDDLNQPLSVQPWGRDGYKRRYWLIEGRDDTHFRIYRESNPALKTHTWWSVADSIPSAQEFAEKLKEDGTQASRRLADSINAAIPRFEQGEEKRRRRDYRIARKAQFSAPSFSLYEGRTRGKRVKYTFSDDEGDDGSDATSARRSNRISGVSTPAEPAGPTYTASGRQVKSRVGGRYGEVMHSGQQAEIDAARSQEVHDDDMDEDITTKTRSSRSGIQGRTNGVSSRSHRYNDVDDMDDESDASSSGNEWDGGDDEDDEADDDVVDEDEDADISGLSSDEDDTGKSLMVSLKVPRPRQLELLAQSEASAHSSPPAEETITVAGNGQHTPGASESPARVHADKPHSNLAVKADLPAPRQSTPSKPSVVTNGLGTPNSDPPTLGLDGALDPRPSLPPANSHPLAMETKLPFSPPKRESPPKALEPERQSGFFPPRFPPAPMTAPTFNAAPASAPGAGHAAFSAPVPPSPFSSATDPNAQVNAPGLGSLKNEDVNMT